jgi:hypothetical protein
LDIAQAAIKNVAASNRERTVDHTHSVDPHAAKSASMYGESDIPSTSEIRTILIATRVLLKDFNVEL